MPLRVVIYPADQTGCGQYRMRLPAAAACATGEVELVSLTQDGVHADVAVFQRPGNRRVAEIIPALRRNGIAVVVDIDDDLAAAHPQSAAFQELHPARSPDMNWRHIKRACQLADLVTVTTPTLAERYGGEKACVLPNRVPAAMLDIQAERDGRTVGWGGFTSTHIGDLAVTRGGVARAVQDSGARFLAVGTGDGVKRDLGLAEEPDATGPIPFAKYHRTLAQLDVTIAPLADTLFNRAKSGLKLLEATALGIPCIASPRPDYQRLHAEGIGVLAKDRARDWHREMRRLIDDPQLRAEIAAQGREIVREHHTYETNGWRWQEAWAQAQSNLHRMSSASRDGVQTGGSLARNGARGRPSLTVDRAA